MCRERGRDRNRCGTEQEMWRPAAGAGGAVCAEMWDFHIRLGNLRSFQGAESAAERRHDFHDLVGFKREEVHLQTCDVGEIWG